MNKKRILKLIEIMRRQSDMDHKLSLSQISALLDEDGISNINRKTLYDDFRTLSEYGYDIEYDDGYYLSEAPFSLSEIKIIIDSLNSLRNLDERFLDGLKRKLYSFISIYETDELKKLEYRNTHSDRRFINRMEDSLQAIMNNETLKNRRINKEEEEEIVPLFLHRENDYYYLYYHYVGNDRIYHVRFDNILKMKNTGNRSEILVDTSKIISHIAESSSSFYSAKAKLIRFEITDNSPYLRQRLQDDFPDLVFTKNGFSIRASISDAFFAKLTSYGDQIKISDAAVADQYIAFLNKIITRNNSENKSN